MRNQLAALDFNHHMQRPGKETHDGQPYLSSQFSRKTKEWVVYQKRQEKDYAYITGYFILLLSTIDICTCCVVVEHYIFQTRDIHMQCYGNATIMPNNNLPRDEYCANNR